MKFFAAYLLLVGMVLPTVFGSDHADASRENTFPLPIRHLSMEKLERIMRTEASEVCDRNHIQTCWDGLLQAETDRIINSAENSTHLRRRVTGNDPQHQEHAFVVCDVEYAQSGEVRKALITESLGTNSLMNLYNKDDMSCFALRSTLADIRALPENFEAIPILPEMKIPKGTMEIIAASDISIGRIEVIMCPGVQHLDALLGEVEYLVKGTHVGGHRQLRVDNFVTSRSHVVETTHPWHRALGNGTLDCNGMLSQAAVDSFEDTILFAIPPSSRGGEWRSCLQMLIADIALQDDVCFVGAFEDPQILNDLASGIIQSGSPGSKPMYDVGLDGSGQVVALSDSGIDIDNCYFYDSDQNTPKSPVGTVTGPVNPIARKVIQYISFADDSDYANGHGSKSRNSHKFAC